MAQRDPPAAAADRDRRHRRCGPATAARPTGPARVRRLLRRAGFTEVAFDAPAGEVFTVGSHRHAGAPRAAGPAGPAVQLLPVLGSRTRTTRCALTRRARSARTSAAAAATRRSLRAARARQPEPDRAGRFRRDPQIGRDDPAGRRRGLVQADGHVTRSRVRTRKVRPARRTRTWPRRVSVGAAGFTDGAGDDPRGRGVVPVGGCRARRRRRRGGEFTVATVSSMSLP